MAGAIRYPTQRQERPLIGRRSDQGNPGLTITFTTVCQSAHTLKHTPLARDKGPTQILRGPTYKLPMRPPYWLYRYSVDRTDPYATPASVAS
ncbi:protein of unknown function [Nitratireductor aquimarinus]